MAQGFQEELLTESYIKTAVTKSPSHLWIPLPISPAISWIVQGSYEPDKREQISSTTLTNAKIHMPHE